MAEVPDDVIEALTELVAARAYGAARFGRTHPETQAIIRGAYRRLIAPAITGVCAEAVAERSQSDGWGEGQETADHPVNCRCAPCTVQRLQESNYDLRDQLARAAERIEQLEADADEVVVAEAVAADCAYCQDPRFGVNDGATCPAILRVPAASPVPAEQPSAAEQALAARAEQALAQRVLDAHDEELGTQHGVAYRVMVADHWRLIETFEPHRTGARAAFDRRAGEEETQAELLGHRLTVGGGVTPGHPTHVGAGYDCCCGECLSLRRPGSAQQPDGWGEGVEAADHPVNCGCAPCVIGRLRDSNDSLRDELGRAAEEIDRLRAEQSEER